jgi:hypothetical protein
MDTACGRRGTTPENGENERKWWRKWCQFILLRPNMDNMNLHHFPRVSYFVQPNGCCWRGVWTAFLTCPMVPSSSDW